MDVEINCNIKSNYTVKEKALFRNIFVKNQPFKEKK
jgi:hypothetical protein